MIYSYIRKSNSDDPGKATDKQIKDRKGQYGAGGKELLVVALNCGVQAYGEYTIGVPEPGFYKEIINSDDPEFAGGGCTNPRQIRAKKKPAHGMPYSITVKMPPVGGCIFKKK
jgi:1,4-alpha-glucan branching enzyme